MARKIYKYIIIFSIAGLAVFLGLLAWSNRGVMHQVSSRDEAILTPAATSSANGMASTKDMPIPLRLPEGAGHVVEGYTAPGEGAKLIIHIQDIHTNYEAQKNLSRILESLVKDNNLKLIMVEGGWGDVSLAYLRSYADTQRRHVVAEEYLKEGKISGEEYLDIVSNYDIKLEGIEDEALYKANLETFFAIETFRHEASLELARLYAVIAQLKPIIYSPQLVELEKTKNDYDNEKITLADYYRYLYQLAGRIKLDMRAYPNFTGFIAVVESEREIRFAVAENERATLIETLSKNLSKQDLTALVAQSLEFRLNKVTPLQYHEYVLGVAHKTGENLQRYPNLQQYIEYIRAHETIETIRLFEEADDLLRIIEGTLIKDPQQRQLYYISRSAQALDNFLHIKLVPTDFAYYKQNRTNFITAGWIDFLQQQAARNNLRISDIEPAYTLDKNLSTLVRFYDLVNERDDAFVQNATRLMSEYDVTLAALIAGGFHTPNLKRKFQEHGISYIVAAPYTSQQTDPEQYRYILKYKAGRE